MQSELSGALHIGSFNPANACLCLSLSATLPLSLSPFLSPRLPLVQNLVRRSLPPACVFFLSSLSPRVNVVFMSVTYLRYVMLSFS